jgi:hypothetical protein
MKGDFSRDAFDPSRHDYRVLMQQGRVQLDADWNEQASIVLHRLETIVRDAFGVACGPEDHCGFAIFAPDQRDFDFDFGIGAGRYYIDGMLVENDRPIRYAEREGARLGGGRYIIYLDVWEEFVAPQQDPALLDPALGGFDTTARTRLEWRVRALLVDELPSRDEIRDAWPHLYLGPESIGARGRLAAHAHGGYHGAENQLYRVEIHDPGRPEFATFKWSRDNGAIAYAIASVAEKVVTLETFGRDAHAAIVAGDWVEICDDDDAGAQKPARGLFVVAEAQPSARTVTLETAPGYSHQARKHPVLRRWDQRSAPLQVETGDDAWTPLEGGVAVRFAEHGADGGAAVYRAGDYWTIPARTAEGGTVLWPREDGRPAFREPAGVRHRYAPLAGIHITEAGKMKIDRERHDYRRRFRPFSHEP